MTGRSRLIGDSSEDEHEHRYRKAVRDAVHYDYRNQAWIVNGKVAECGHPASMRPGCCYSGEHVGEDHTCHEECH